MWPVSNRGYGPSSLPSNQVPADLRRTRMAGRVGRVGRVGDVEIVSSIDELNGGPQSLPYDAMPVDLLPRVLEEYQRNSNGTLSPVGVPMAPTDEWLSKIKDDTGIISSTMVLTWSHRS